MAAIKSWLPRRTDKARRRSARTGRRRSTLPRSGALRVEQLEGRMMLATDLPTVVDPNLEVRAVADELELPIGMAFLNEDEFFVLEKNSGKVLLVSEGESSPTEVLDLAVNNASERGLLGIALHPEFHTDEDKQFVYLYWTSTAPPPPDDNPFEPTLDVTDDEDLLESAENTDTSDVLAVPLLGNRVDRFIWDGESLTFDQNLITLRAFQRDAAPTPEGQGDGEQPARGNHDGGVIRFGPDGNLYIIIGDVGRRGWMQNLEDGPTDEGVPDDQFGGPEPDDAHLTGVVLRLDEDGNAPEDNPFFEFGAELIGDGETQVGENLQKVFAYGIRNSFGMAFDPLSGKLWTQENGDDSFDELNLVEPGFNSGWIQVMGPLERIDEFKAMETSDEFFGLQQLRWSPENIADSPEEALEQLLDLPGSHYSDPEFSWKFAVAPAAIGFLDSRALGPQYRGDLFVGLSVPEPDGGVLMRFDLTGNRRRIAVDDPGLEDRVDDNLEKRTLNESEDNVFGRNWGIVTEIQTGPDGNLYVVSLEKGAIYEISRESRPGQREARKFEATLTGDQEVEPVDTDARGFARFHLDKDGESLRYHLNVFRLEDAFAAHIHLGPPGEDGPVIATLFAAEEGERVRSNGLLAKGVLTDDDIVAVEDFDGEFASLLEEMRAGNTYVNVHTDDFPGGEIRGQIVVDGSHNEDADRDGRVDLSDLLGVVKHLRDRTPPGLASRFLDTDLDGDVTLGDLLAVVVRLRNDRAGPSPGNGDEGPGRGRNSAAFDLSIDDDEEEEELLSDRAFLADVAQARQLRR